MVLTSIVRCLVVSIDDGDMITVRSGTNPELLYQAPQKLMTLECSR